MSAFASFIFHYLIKYLCRAINTLPTMLMKLCSSFNFRKIPFAQIMHFVELEIFGGLHFYTPHHLRHACNMAKGLK